MGAHPHTDALVIHTEDPLAIVDKLHIVHPRAPVFDLDRASCPCVSDIVWRAGDCRSAPGDPRALVLMGHPDDRRVPEIAERLVDGHRLYLVNRLYPVGA